MSEVDRMQLLKGDPIAPCDGITLYQATIGEIVEFGEQRFMNMLWTLCSAPWDMPAMFDDIGKHFMTVTEWELFYSFVNNMSPEDTSLLFGDFDWSVLTPMLRTNPDESQEVVLVHPETGLMVDESMYRVIIPYIKEMIGFQHKNKKPGDKYTAKLMITEDRKNRERNKDKPYESMLFDAVISLVNTEEFAYDYKSVFDITLYQLMKSLTQIQGKKAACALYQASMSGFADTSKIPKIDFSWIYSDEKYKPKGRKLVNNKVKTK